MIRNKIPTLLVFSATAIALLVISSSVSPLSKPLLLQPVQAQTLMTFRTPEPADGEIPCCPLMEPATLTFDVQGTATPSGPQAAKITNGTIQYQEPPNRGNIYNGKILEGTFYNDSRHGTFLSFIATFQNFSATIQSRCSTAEFNTITVIINDVGTSTLEGPVECSSSSQGGGNTTSSSMTGTTTTQDTDSDRDGIPDSSDKCIHNSNQRCFKEGNSTTTTHEQEQPPSTSSNNRTGNQTR